MNSTERDLVERLREDADAWALLTHTVSGPYTASVMHEAADALASIRAERDMAERAAVEAAIPLEALLMAGQGPLSDAVWDGVRNGVGHVRSMLKARAARAIAGEQKP